MKTTLKKLAKKIKMTVKYGAKMSWEKMDQWQRDANGYRLILTYQGRQMSLDFWQGWGISHDPDIEGVIDCLLSDASGADQSFENWCRDLGYDTDSRKAEKIYKQVVKQTLRLKNLLGDDFEKFLFAERD
jgi:hypothetical protein